MTKSGDALKVPQREPQREPQPESQNNVVAPHSEAVAPTSPSAMFEQRIASMSPHSANSTDSSPPNREVTKNIKPPEVVEENRPRGLRR